MRHLAFHRVAALSLGVFVTTIYAGETDVMATFKILLPVNETTQSRYWADFHDYNFDLDGSGKAANSLPMPGSRRLERLAKDGDNSDRATDLLVLHTSGIDVATFGDLIDRVTSEIVSISFTLAWTLDSEDSELLSHGYFSYSSMVLTSHDFIIPKNILDDSLVIATQFYSQVKLAEQLAEETTDEAFNELIDSFIVGVS